MPKNDSVTCPQCSCSVLSSVSRLIRDSCSHLKCRLCLLKEEEGCLACKLKENNDSHETNSGDVSLEEHETNVDISAENGALESENKSVHSLCHIPHDPEICKTSTNPISNSTVSSVKTAKRRSFKIGNHLTLLPGTPAKYLCTICNKECTSKMTIRYHNYCASKTKPFTCETCGKGFVTKTHFEYHNRIHTGILPYVCSVCGKGFKQQGKLNRHSRMHSGERPFVCQECGKTFASIESLKTHQRGHNEKPHVCPVCSKSFKDYSNFKKHIYRHKGEKTYMCDECGKTFAFRRSLMAHIFIHTRERNFACNTCNRKFAMKRDLKRHEIVHSVVRPHSCSLCKIGFRRKDNLERHMKNTHPETRMVSVGPLKQKSRTDSCKLTIKNNKLNDLEEKRGKSGDAASSIHIESIPPSQMINSEILHSVPILSKKKLIMNDKDMHDSNPEAQLNEKIDSTNIGRNDVSCSPTDVRSTIQESLQIQMQNQCCEYVSNAHKSHENQNSCEKELPSPTTPVFPPKKIIEYYRAVPVINRSSNVSNIIYNESLCVKENNADSVRRGEGTNCVPTITRASEYISNSVITRNHQQNNTSVVKPTYAEGNFEKLEKISCIREPQIDQPSLRKLLHDVKCCDSDNILNLTSDVNASNSSLLQEDLRQLDDPKFDRTNRETEFLVSKDPDTYMADSLAECGIHEYDSSCIPRYVNLDQNRKMTADGLFSDVQFRLNSNSSFHYLTQSPYVEYQDNSNQVVEHHYSKVPSSDDTTRYEGLKKSVIGNYDSYNTKHVDVDTKVSGTNNPESIPCMQSIGLPVIVGAKKITNNIICSNFSS